MSGENIQDMDVYFKNWGWIGGRYTIFGGLRKSKFGRCHRGEQPVYKLMDGFVPKIIFI